MTPINIFRVVLGCLGILAVSALADEQSSPPLLVSRTGAGKTWSDLEDLQKAAASGVPDALSALGQMLVTGEQMPKDVPRGMEMLERAARANQASAAFRLGKIYEDGDGVARDANKALSYYLQAAKAGVAEAQYNLGAMYVSARDGLKRDYAEGLAWLILATKHGADADGEKRVRERLSSTHRTELIAQAEQRAVQLEKDLPTKKEGVPQKAVPDVTTIQNGAAH